MLAAGVDIVVGSKRLGHSSVAITSDTYTHLLPGVGSEAAAKAWSLVPRADDASQRVREQGVSSSVAGSTKRDDDPASLQVRDLLVEPPIGIEPMTYALRVRRSDRLS